MLPVGTIITKVIGRKNLHRHALRRSFGRRSSPRHSSSLPNDASARRIRRCISTTPRDATITNSLPASSSRACLRSLAQEADRLTQMASTYRHSTVSTSNSEKKESDMTFIETTTMSDYTKSLQAATELLKLSHSMGSESRGDDDNDVLNHDSMADFTTSLHRSLLTVISWCTKVILAQDEATRQLVEIRSNHEPATYDNVDYHLLFDTALRLARRANDLHLPLHLPLYQQLAKAASTVSYQSDLVEQTLEISSWIVSSLNVMEVNATLFAPAVRALVRSHDFSQVADLLVGMRYLHDIRYLPVDMTSELLLLLRDIAQQTGCIKSTPATTEVDSSQTESTIRRRDALLERNISQLVSLLEPSVTFFLQQKSDLPKESLRWDMKALLEGMVLEPSKVDGILVSFEELIENDINVHGERDEDGQENDKDDQNVTRQSGQTIPSSHMSPEATANRSNRQRLSELLKKKIFGPAALSSSDEDIYSDESVGNGESRDFLYMREPGDASHEFPDVTAQFVKLIHGRPILFTALYESILMQNEFGELEQDLFDSFMMDSSDSDSDLDDDDDDNDDY